MKETKKGKFANKANTILSPNKPTGIADFLDDTAESKSVNTSVRKNINMSIQKDAETQSQIDDTVNVVRENFRFAESLAERLRLYAFNKRMTKTDVVVQALEEFFTHEGY